MDCDRDLSRRNFRRLNWLTASSLWVRSMATCTQFEAPGTLTAQASPNSAFPSWKGNTGTGVDSSPAIANGMVYVGSEDGKLYAFGLP